MLFLSKDNSGFIDENELFQVVKQFNPSFTKDHIKKMIQKIDKDNSGKVSIDGKILISIESEIQFSKNFA